MQILSSIIKSAIDLGATFKQDDNPIKAQKEVLRSLLEKAKNTSFGTYYNFSGLLDSRELQHEFAKTIPYHDYDDMEFWWKQSLQAYPDIAWPGVMKNFAVSSGTTGNSKHIPVSEEMLDSIRNAGIYQILSLSNFTDLPEQFYDKQILMLGSSTNLKEVDQHKEGEISGISAANIPNWFHNFYKPGQEIAKIDDWDERIKAIAKEAKNWDIGSLSGIPSWIELMLEEVIRHNKLDTIHDIWPNLAVYTSGGVALQPYIKSFDKLFGKPVQYIDTYLASEGYLATQTRPNTDAMQLLCNNGIYFEFVPFKPENMLESGKINPEAQALTLEDVKEGEEYVLVISTVSGAWRYMIGDTVAFTNKEKAEIKITGRTKFFLNVVGSQLSVNKMDEAIKSVNETFHINVKEYTLAAVKDGDDFYHHWYLGVENPEQASSIESIKQHIDTVLKENNKNYGVARNKALKGLKLTIVPVDTFIEWTEENKQKGGQVKIAKVMKEKDFREWQDFADNRK